MMRRTSFFRLLLIALAMMQSQSSFAAARRIATFPSRQRRMIQSGGVLVARQRPTFAAFHHHHHHATTRERRMLTKSRQAVVAEEPFSRRMLTTSSHGSLLSSSSSFHRDFSSCTTTLKSSSNSDDEEETTHDDSGFFAPDVDDFESLGITSPVLLSRLKAMGLKRPTAVQAAAFQAIGSSSSSNLFENKNGLIHDVTVGSETGSGKSLAYLLPLMNDILERKQTQRDSDNEDNDVGGGLGYDYARAVILVPNKELVQQLVRMALPLAGDGGLSSSLVYGSIGIEEWSGRRSGSTSSDSDKIPEHERVRLAIFPGGLHEPIDFQPFRQRLAGDAEPVDLIISTPAALGPLGLSPKNIDMFADIPTLVVDEADMLLDGGYIRALENVLLGFRRADRLVNANSWGKEEDIDSSFMGTRTQHVFVAATLPDFGLRSVDAYLQKRFPHAVRVTMAGMHQARHSGLVAQTKWIYEDAKKGRMQKLVQLLQTPPRAATSSSDDSSNAESDDDGLLGAKVMVFLNSVDDVEGACQALSRAGVNALPYHAKLSLGERTKTLDRFRKYKSSNSNNNKKENNDAVPVLVCTDLAARGLDVPGVDVVVQLQFASNVVSHLHRMGRCGRRVLESSSNDNTTPVQGRGIVFYGSTEEELVKVVQQAEAQQERMVLDGVEVDPTLQEDKDGEEDGGSPSPAGSVKNAFSRKRGFTKKRKKLKRQAAAEGGSPESNSYHS